MRTYDCLLFTYQGLISPYLSLDLFHAHVIPIDLMQGGVSTSGKDRRSHGRYGDQTPARACQSLVLILRRRNEKKIYKTTDQRQIILSATTSAQATMLRLFQCTEQGGEPPSGHAVTVSDVPSETSCILAFFGWDTISPSMALLSTGPPTAVNEHQLASPSRGLMVCSLCQRQIPIWNFVSSTTANRPMDSSGTRQHRARAFDVLREHRTHCPYVVKTTPSPSLAPVSIPYTRNGEANVWDMALSPSMELLEGWRAHLNILLRSDWRRISEYASLGGKQGNIGEGSGEKPIGGVVSTVRTQHGGVSP